MNHARLVLGVSWIAAQGLSSYGKNACSALRMIIFVLFSTGSAFSNI